MNLYLTKNGQYAGTMKDAGKGHMAVEVPTDKAGLIAYLNGLVEAPVSPVQSLGDDLAPSGCPSCHGQNTSCPEGCGRDPATGELDGSTYVSPLTARTVIAGIDAGMVSQAVRQFDGPNLAKVVTAVIERMALLGRAVMS